MGVSLTKQEVQHGLDSSDLGDLECCLSLFLHVRASYLSLILALAERDLMEHARMAGDCIDGEREPTFNFDRLSRMLADLQANGLGMVVFWNKTTSHRGSPGC
jgi:hypothetical protein